MTYQHPCIWGLKDGSVQITKDTATCYKFPWGISVLRTPLILERCKQQKREVDLFSKFGCPKRRTTRSLINSVPKSSHEPLKQRNSTILSSNTCKPAFPFTPVNVCIRRISPRGVFGVNKHLTPFNSPELRVTWRHCWHTNELSVRSPNLRVSLRCVTSSPTKMISF